MHDWCFHGEQFNIPRSKFEHTYFLRKFSYDFCRGIYSKPERLKPLNNKKQFKDFKIFPFFQFGTLYVVRLTPFMWYALFPFYNHWKHRKTCDFAVFPGSVESNRRIQNPVKRRRWSALRNQLIAKSIDYFRENAPSQMLKLKFY